MKGRKRKRKDGGPFFIVARRDDRLKKRHAPKKKGVTTRPPDTVTELGAGHTRASREKWQLFLFYEYHFNVCFFYSLAYTSPPHVTQTSSTGLYGGKRHTYNLTSCLCETRVGREIVDYCLCLCLALTRPLLLPSPVPSLFTDTRTAFRAIGTCV
jgi:hypothetical protein